MRVAGPETFFVQPGSELAQGRSPGSIALEKPGHDLPFFRLDMDAAGVFRVTESLSLALISVHPAGLIAEGNAAGMLALGGALLQTFPDVVTERSAVELGESPDHLREEHPFGLRVVDVLDDGSEADLMLTENAQRFQGNLQITGPAVEGIISKFKSIKALVL